MYCGGFPFWIFFVFALLFPPVAFVHTLLPLFFLMSFSVVSSHLLFLCASHLPISYPVLAFPRPLTPVDPEWPRHISAASAVLSLSLSCSLEVESASGRKTSHFSTLEIPPLGLDIWPPSHVTTPRAPRCCSQICTERRGGTETSVVL